ncbi:MAG: AAA family ATPase [Lachnospiraceae bacterium]|nr:AAA family ATPase [Lachnospiraceae bacterium]
MPDYQWAVGKGKIVTADYDRSMALNAEQVESELRAAINNSFDRADVSPVNNEFKEVYKIVIPREEENQTFFVCLKGTTPGGRSNLQNEQRIQQKAKYLNYANDRKNEGNKVSCLGVYKHDSETIFCAWNINPSTASPETPISKQIKITTIARALTEGFVQQMSGSGEYVCAFKKEFIYFYLVNSSWIHNMPISHLNEHNSEMIEEEKNLDEEKNPSEIGANILFYGVPGAGKSHEIDQMIVQERSERVVFHPDYTYSDFVGQILPRIIKKEGETEGKLRYVFEPGPFTKMLKKAHDDPDNRYFLVIEEINRGNAPAIFGDIFQLLDRNDDGSGKYHISNYDMAKVVYGEEHEDEIIKMPANLTLLATMNTSDQNVFTLDTAFQRRWEMHLIKNDVYKADHADKKIGGSEISWGRFADITNMEIIRFGEETGSSEDKRLGAYFARLNELSRDKFPEKVLKYLWDDAFKMDRYTYFNEGILSVDGIIDVFMESQSEVDVLKRVLKLGVYQKMLGQAVASENTKKNVGVEEGTDDE